MMIRILAFFIFLISTFQMPTVAFADYDTNDIEIRVYADGAVCPQGIQIETSDIVNPNNNKPFQAIVDKDCKVTIKGACEVKKRNNFGKITYIISDPNHKYKTVTVHAEQCKFAQRLNPYTQEEIGIKYPGPKTVAQYAVNMDNKLEFYPVCDSDVKLPSKVSYLCSEFFKDTKVQFNEAVALVEKFVSRAAWNPSGLIVVECNPKIRKDWYYHYLQCTSFDGRYVFEFPFRSLNTGGQASDNANREVRFSVAQALCWLQDSTQFRADAIGCLKTNNNMDEVRQMCTEIDFDARDFSYSAMYHYYPKDQQVLSTAGGTDRANILFDVPYCAFDFHEKVEIDEEDRGLDEVSWLNSRVFETTSVSSGEDATLLLNQYIRFQASNNDVNVTSVWCGAGTRPYKYKDGHHADVKSCRVTTNGSEIHNVDFLFKEHHVTQGLLSGDKEANKGIAQMACISSGGQFDGENCSAIGPAQCAALGSRLPGGTKWHEQLGVCVSNDAKSFNNLERTKKYVKIGAGFAIALVLTVTGPAGAAPAIAWVSFALGQGGSVVSEILKDVKNQHAVDFIIGINNMCPYAETCNNMQCSAACENSTCAKNTLADAYGNISGMIDDHPESPLSQAVGDAHDTALIKIHEDCVDTAFAERLEHSTDTLGTIIAITDVASVIGSTMDLGSGIKGAAAGSAKNAAGTVVKLGKTLQKSGKVVKLFSKNAKAMRVLKKLAQLKNGWGNIETIANTDYENIMNNKDVLTSSVIGATIPNVVPIGQLVISDTPPFDTLNQKTQGKLSNKAQNTMHAIENQQTRRTTMTNKRS